MQRSLMTRRDRFDAGELAERAWDVIVAGAGPAGCVAARESSRAGARVRLVERATLPRDKACGCCLSAAGVDLLERAGLGDGLRSLNPTMLRTLDLRAGESRARIAVRPGAVAARADLDSMLALGAVREGVTLLDGVPGRLGPGSCGAGCEVQLGTGVGSPTARCRVVVVADGLGGGFLSGHGAFRPRISRRSRIGLWARVPGGTTPGGEIMMAIGPDAYVGMVRLPDGSTDIAASAESAAVRARGPEAVVRGVLKSAGLESPVNVRWRGTPTLTRRREVAAPGVFVIGDAGGYVEPFTGEGMTWAIATGLAVVPSVARALAGDTPGAALRWHGEHGAMLRVRRAACAAVSAIAHRPRLAAACLEVGGLAPGLAGWVSALFSRPIHVGSAA